MESTLKRPLQDVLYCSTPFLQKAHLETTRRNQLMYDVIIIGAGVTGCAVARELSRYPTAPSSTPVSTHLQGP